MIPRNSDLDQSALGLGRLLHLNSEPAAVICVALPQGAHFQLAAERDPILGCLMK